MKWTPIIAMVCITILECFALSHGVNGAVFGIAIAVIGGLGGYEVHKIRTRKGGN